MARPSSCSKLMVFQFNAASKALRSAWQNSVAHFKQELCNHQEDASHLDNLDAVEQMLDEALTNAETILGLSAELCAAVLVGQQLGPPDNSHDKPPMAKRIRPSPPEAPPQYRRWTTPSPSAASIDAPVKRLMPTAKAVARSTSGAGIAAQKIHSPSGNSDFFLARIPPFMPADSATQLVAEYLACFMTEYAFEFNAERIVAALGGDGLTDWHYLLWADSAYSGIPVASVLVLPKGNSSKNRGIGYCDLKIDIEASLDTIKSWYDVWSEQNPFTYDAPGGITQTAVVSLQANRE